MRLKFFSVSANPSQQEEEAINHFLASHRVTCIEKQPIQSQELAYGSIVITYFYVCGKNWSPHA